MLSKPGPPDDGVSITTRAAWLTGAKTLSFLVALALPLLLVRLLDAGAFGLYKQAFLVVNTAVSVLPLGFAMSAFYFWPREPAKRDAIVFHVLVVHLAITGLAGLALATWPGLLAAVFQDPGLVAHGRALGLVVVLWGTSSFLEVVAIANGETRFAAGLTVAVQLSRALFLGCAALRWATVEALIRAALAHGVVQLGLTLLYLRSRFGRLTRGIDGPLLRAQWSYVLPHGAAAWLSWMFLELHSYVVAHHVDPATFAVYAVGCFQVPLVGILSESAGAVAIPQVSRLQKEGRTGEIVVLAAELVRRLALICLPLYAFLLMTRHELIVLLFTEEYLASAGIFAVNLTLVPLAVFAAAGDSVMRAYAGCRFFLVKLRLVLAGLTVIGLLVATRRFGPIGAIVVAAGATALDRAAVCVRAGRILGLRRSDLALVLFKDLVKIALACLAAGLLAFVARRALDGAAAGAVLLGCGSVFAAGYLAALLAWGVPRPEERAALARLLRGRVRRRAVEERAPGTRPCHENPMGPS